VLKIYSLMALKAFILVCCALIIFRFTCNYLFGLLTCRICRRVVKKGRGVGDRRAVRSISSNGDCAQTNFGGEDAMPSPTIIPSSHDNPHGRSKK